MLKLNEIYLKYCKKLVGIETFFKVSLDLGIGIIIVLVGIGLFYSLQSFNEVSVG